MENDILHGKEKHQDANSVNVLRENNTRQVTGEDVLRAMLNAFQWIEDIHIWSSEKNEFNMVIYHSYPINIEDAVNEWLERISFRDIRIHTSFQRTVPGFRDVYGVKSKLESIDEYRRKICGY